MSKFMTAFLLINSCFLTAFADLPKDLRVQPKQNKLVIHACKVNLLNKINDLWTGNIAQTIERANCTVLSDLNYSTIRSMLSQNSESISIRSIETIDVKKQDSAGSYWKTCDAEDGDCLESDMGGFDRPVENIYTVNRTQQNKILNALKLNSNRQDTHLYFLVDEVETAQRSIEGIYTYHDLQKARLMVK